MARSTAPEFSRGQVKRAGRNVRNDEASPEDHQIIENYRASHTHVLNAFQASLRNRAKEENVTVAQRLKRRVTIYDKLKRRPNFSLTEMQDIAGCRLIFQRTEDLNSFRNAYHKARFKHKLLTSNDRYNYILSPKADGYRGVHDVYEYKSRRAEGELWNKLRIELQYRTIYQHAWATAVEVAGLLTNNEHKFGRAAEDYVEFFCITSEIIARTFENSNSCLPNVSLGELADRFEAVDEKIELLNLFRQYNKIAKNVVGIEKNAILFFNKNAEKGAETEIRSYASFADAVRELEVLEEANLASDGSYDLVLVRSVSNGSKGSLQSAYRNYFADTRDFIEYIEQGLKPVR